MAKLSNIGGSGTSFHGTTIYTTVARLREVIGDPQCECNDGSDKCNFDWSCETEGGIPFTIYDWKEYRRLSETETISFHIGGRSKSDTEIAGDELFRLL